MPLKDLVAFTRRASYCSTSVYLAIVLRNGILLLMAATWGAVCSYGQRIFLSKST
jgi:hypothetical protein